MNSTNDDKVHIYNLMIRFKKYIHNIIVIMKLNLINSYSTHMHIIYLASKPESDHK